MYLCIYSFIQVIFTQYLLMPGPVLDSGNTLVNKTHTAPSLLKVVFLMAEIKKKSKK